MGIKERETSNGDNDFDDDREQNETNNLRKSSTILLLVLLLVRFFNENSIIQNLRGSQATTKRAEKENRKHYPKPQNTTIQDLEGHMNMSAANIESQATTVKKREYLLSVPFYVYEDLAWTDATIGGESIHESWRKYKHGGDYWLMQASLKDHPMRTHNMTEARLFFVPWLMNIIDSSVYKASPSVNKTICWKAKCDHELILDSVEKLRQSPAFQKYPDHHVIVRSMYSSANDKWNKLLLRQDPQFQRFLDVFKKMQVLVWEGVDRYADVKGRHSFTSYHVGTPCPVYEGEEKPYDVAMIAQTKTKFKARRSICRWIENINKNIAVNRSSTSLIRNAGCGIGQQCPTLAQAKFGFHVAGDTYSSQRLMDTILSGTVPIFTHLHQYELAGDWIDWSQLSYYLPVEDAKGYKNEVRYYPVTRHSLLPSADQGIFEQRLRAILKDEEGYKSRHHKVLEHIPLFDYTTLYPFDTYMYLFQAELFPETRHPPGSSRWSAFRLPPQLFVYPPP